MNKHIVLLPGLGFTKLLFGKLPVGGQAVQMLEWIEPKQEETVTAYALRLARLVESGGKPLILIGHSFGGIMVQEMANHLPVEKIVLVSSVKSRLEIPLHFRAVAPLRLHHLFTKRLTFKALPLFGKYYGYDTHEVRGLFAEMVGSQSDHLLQWSLKSLSQWRERKPSPVPMVHLHGQCDKTFPIGNIRQPFTVLPNADHMMVYKQPQKVWGLIKSEIE